MLKAWATYLPGRHAHQPSVRMRQLQTFAYERIYDGEAKH